LVVAAGQDSRRSRDPGDALDQTASVEFLESDGIAAAAENALFAKASSMLRRLPFDELDVW